MNFIASLLVILLASIAFAAEPAKDLPPASYFAGEYSVIGRMPDSPQVYSGTVKLVEKSDTAFDMIRKIGGKEIKGEAFLDHAKPPAERPAVLRIRFAENGQNFKGAFLWRSDLDNYPRLTGFIYRAEKNKTRSGGLEAWFTTATLQR